VQVISENPYRLARDIRGIGFKTADAIAMKLGVDKTAMVRVRAGISYALTAAMDEGHCGLPTNELVLLAENTNSSAAKNYVHHRRSRCPTRPPRTAHRAIVRLYHSAMNGKESSVQCREYANALMLPAVRPAIAPASMRLVGANLRITQMMAAKGTIAFSGMQRRHNSQY